MYFNVNFNVFFKLIKVHLFLSELYKILCLAGSRHRLIYVVLFNIYELLHTLAHLVTVSYNYLMYESSIFTPNTTSPNVNLSSTYCRLPGGYSGTPQRVHLYIYITLGCLSNTNAYIADSSLSTLCYELFMHIW